MSCVQCNKALKIGDIVVEIEDRESKKVLVCSWECSYDFRLQAFSCDEYKLKESV
jgi:hypothetical protein